MKTNEIIKNNVLIATFMNNWTDTGLEPAYCVFKHKGYEAYELSYHKSWDWLMPVIQKMNSLLYPNEDDGYADALFQQGNEMILDLEKACYFGYEAETIKTIYNKCIEFIKWYNKHNEK